MKISVKKRSGKLLDVFDVSPSITVDEFKALFYKSFHFYPERQWFNIGAVKGDALREGTLEANGVEDGTVLFFKDLGVQMSWRLVFVMEYLGPLLIFPLFYLAPCLVYSDCKEALTRTLTQRVAFWLTIIHFAKRECETLFVHRFSSATMPIERLPINCFHYWGIFALAVSYFLFHPKYVAPFDNHPAVVYCCAGLMLIFEFLNLQTHVVLRNLRPRGTKTRGIPHNWGFQVVSCANYLWESCAWLMFAIMINCFTGWVFLVVAVSQMTVWALKRHRNYRKDFKAYPVSRTAIFPLIL